MTTGNYSKICQCSSRRLNLVLWSTEVRTAPPLGGVWARFEGKKAEHPRLRHQLVKGKRTSELVAWGRFPSTAVGLNAWCWRTWRWKETWVEKCALASLWSLYTHSKPFSALLLPWRLTSMISQAAAFPLGLANGRQQQQIKKEDRAWGWDVDSCHPRAPCLPGLPGPYSSLQVPVPLLFPLSL